MDAALVRPHACKSRPIIKPHRYLRKHEAVARLRAATDDKVLGLTGGISMLATMLWILGIFAIATVTVVLVRMIFEGLNVQLKEVQLSVPDLDPRLEGMRIFFGSDIHAGPPLRRRGMRKLIHQISALHPDLVLLGGDYVGANFHGADYFYPALAKLKVPLGVYGVMGNHDYWENGPLCVEHFDEAATQALVNEHVRLHYNGAPVNIAGVDDLWAGTPDLASTCDGIEQQEFSIFISHNPDVFAQGLPFKNENGFDLALAGHTHGGQITGWGKWSIAPTDYGKRYLSDWRYENGVPMLVSNGIGCNGFPIRFYADAEMHLIVLTRGEAGVHNLNCASSAEPLRSETPQTQECR